MVIDTEARLINRELQLDLLERLAEKYPEQVDVQSWVRQNPAINVNLHYLAEHDLIDGRTSKALAHPNLLTQARINARGLDFLADDGGLSAILGVVTVKLHEETIRQLLIDRVNAADIPAGSRDTLRDTIRNLPSKALEKLTEKLLESGADRLLGQGPRLLELLSQLG